MRKMIDKVVSGHETTSIDLSDKIALIDADKLKYIVTNSIWNHYQNEGEYPEIDFYLKAEVNSLIDNIGAKDYIFVFSGKSKNTFRYALANEKEYKGNRRGKKDYRFYERKYQDMQSVFDFMKKNYNTLMFDDIEADDIISLIQNDNSFIVSDDKDLKQIEGWHFDFKNKELVFVSEEYSIKAIAKQLLMGDSTDNIAGIKGYGKVKAEKILKEIPANYQFEAVIKEYVTNYGYIKGYDYFSEVWQLVKLKVNKSDYIKKKYKEAFNLIEILQSI